MTADGFCDKKVVNEIDRVVVQFLPPLIFAVKPNFPNFPFSFARGPLASAALNLPRNITFLFCETAKLEAPRGVEREREKAVCDIRGEIHA